MLRWLLGFVLASCVLVSARAECVAPEPPAIPAAIESQAQSDLFSERVLSYTASFRDFANCIEAAATAADPSPTAEEIGALRDSLESVQTDVRTFLDRWNAVIGRFNADEIARQASTQ